MQAISKIFKGLLAGLTAVIFYVLAWIAVFKYVLLPALRLPEGSGGGERQHMGPSWALLLGALLAFSGGYYWASLQHRKN